ncbi:hypothetical protein GQF03_06940 [Sneathiella chungangensis]|uniref:Fatty acid desaturase domain-containing protein n=1 Tax=Sneathiella chungangensis TaxID=1418234 RepID=A0A845MG83_9PROT|nr:fatty acid desaturase [Sneathiella chungangensis]MZR22064.1 hypothetical protein [Sneathiella chungangensis]
MDEKPIQIPTEFKRREDGYSWALVISNAVVVAASGIIAWHVDTWWAYVIAFVLVGARGQACYILQHEAMHNLLFEKVKMNERVGVVLSAFLGTQFYLGRKIHWNHHTKVGADSDPNQLFHDVTERPPGWKISAFFIANLLGSRLVALVQSLILVFTGFFRKNEQKKRRNAPPRLISAKKSRVDLVALFAVQLLMFICISLLSSPFVYVLLYVLPLSTLTSFFELMRSFSEHVLPGQATCEAEEKRRFYMVAGPVERFFISQFDFHYHHVHHLYPNVVTFKVKALHEWLLENDPNYTSKFKERPGYVGTAWRYIWNKPFGGCGAGFPL